MIKGGEPAFYGTDGNGKTARVVLSSWSNFDKLRVLIQEGAALTGDRDNAAQVFLDEPTARELHQRLGRMLGAEK